MEDTKYFIVVVTGIFTGNLQRQKERNKVFLYVSCCLQSGNGIRMGA
jgi:hypothetical protein